MSGNSLTKDEKNAGGESDEDTLEIEIDFTQALYDYWKRQEKEQE